MDLSIALFFVEMLRASTGGLWTAALEWRAEQARLGAERAALVEQEAWCDSQTLRRAEDRSIALGVPGTRISQGARWIQEPAGLDPLDSRAADAGPGSVLSAEGDALPDFLAKLAQGGARVELAPEATEPPLATPLAGSSGTFSAVRYRLRTYTLYPPTPYAEPFNLVVPSPLPVSPSPLLVVFHKYGASHNDVLQNTDF